MGKLEKKRKKKRMKRRKKKKRNQDQVLSSLRGFSHIPTLPYSSYFYTYFLLRNMCTTSTCSTYRSTVPLPN